MFQLSLHLHSFKNLTLILKNVSYTLTFKNYGKDILSVLFCEKNRMRSYSKKYFVANTQI